MLELIVGRLGHTYNKYPGAPLQPSTYLYDKANTGLMRSIRRGCFDRKRSRPDNRLFALLGRVPDLQISTDELLDLESRSILALARLRRSLSNYNIPWACHDLSGTRALLWTCNPELYATSNLAENMLSKTQADYPLDDLLTC